MVGSRFSGVWLAIPCQKQSAVWWLETELNWDRRDFRTAGFCAALLNHWLAPTQTAQQVKQIQFTRIANLSELQSALAEAKAQGKPVMLDFYADWCVACKEFEKYTFHAKQVETKLSGFVLLQADVTKISRRILSYSRR